MSGFAPSADCFHSRGLRGAIKESNDAITSYFLYMECSLLSSARAWQRAPSAARAGRSLREILIAPATALSIDSIAAGWLLAGAVLHVMVILLTGAVLTTPDPFVTVHVWTGFTGDCATLTE
jgi:hypothetical protein